MRSCIWWRQAFAQVNFGFCWDIYLNFSYSYFTQTFVNTCSYILTLHGRYKKRLGVNRLTLLLQREYGLKIGQTRVRRLFKSMNLPKFSSRKSSTQSTKTFSDDFKNLLNRKFNPDELSDITYLKVGSKWQYLCIVIVSWLLSDHPDADFVIRTFKKAYWRRNCPQGILFRRFS